MQRLIRYCGALLVVSWHTYAEVDVLADRLQPNVLWISAEDISPHLGCYGDPHAITPNLDRLAEEGVRYSHVFTTAGVCAPCRSGIITGMYQTTLGTHQMRCQAKLPDHVRPFPVYLRQAGYYATNNSKEDYQFITPPETWDESSPRAHWRGVRKGQPFFAVFNFTGCHESGIKSDHKYQAVTASLRPDQRQDPARLTTLPPYYPDTPRVREDWKRYYELITAMDMWVGDLIGQLKQDGLYEETIIMFWSDHGAGLPRAKRWLYDSGTHIPLIVRIPKQYRVHGQGERGAVVDELVSSIDLAPTVLNLTGLEIPDHFQGRPFLGEDLPAQRDYVYGARDRMDERYDIIRMVRDKQFKYLRNYESWKTYYQYINYAEQGATMKEIRRLHMARQLPVTAERYFSPTKPVEELYDTQADPHEISNLAGDSKFAETLKRMRSEHVASLERTRDLGLIPESILVERAQSAGNRYSVLKQTGGGELARRVAKAAVSASEGESAFAELMTAIEDQDASIRYWGAIGLGNLGTGALSSHDQLRGLLKDSSAAVRIAAARALCRMGLAGPALPVLINELRNGSQWQRLQAAIVLDEIDQQARPLLKEMRAALVPRSQLFNEGKYTVRVINRALNQLESTDRVVR